MNNYRMHLERRYKKLFVDYSEIAQCLPGLADFIVFIWLFVLTIFVKKELVSNKICDGSKQIPQCIFNDINFYFK
jgi:hypothetical protein